ncbi:MAG: rRNA maturation RNase YbeY [Woeseiaceae bacterium]
MNVSVNVDLQIACYAESIPDKEVVRGWIEDAIRHSAAEAAQQVGVVVRIVDERESRALNYRFRKKDRATNVLAFPAANGAEIPLLDGDPERTLGDLAICGPIVEREAREQGKSPDRHWAHLLVHGTLHLLGFDHQSEHEAEEMERLETRILAARGIDDPYVMS